MIEIVLRSGPPEAMNCAALVCDTCREQVVGRGNIVWAHRYEPQQESSPLFVSHKGQCDRALSAWLKDKYPLAEGWANLWEEAGHFMRYLAHNASNAFADDSEGTYRVTKVAFP